MINKLGNCISDFRVSYSKIFSYRSIAEAVIVKFDDKKIGRILSFLDRMTRREVCFQSYFSDQGTYRSLMDSEYFGYRTCGKSFLMKLSDLVFRKGRSGSVCNKAKRFFDYSLDADPVQAELPGNLDIGQTFPVKSFYLIPIQPVFSFGPHHRSMVGSVMALSEDFEVLNSVIKAVMIFVVNNLASLKRLSKMLLHQMTMFPDSLSVNVDDFVTSVIQRSTLPIVRVFMHDANYTLDTTLGQYA